MYKDTVTLFCRYTTAAGALMWRPYKLKNVDFNADSALILATYGESSQDRAMLHIRCYDGYIGAYQYVQPKAYRADGGEITLQSGQDFSFILYGEYGSTADISDDAYTEGFYNFMNKSYDGVYAVSSVAIYSVIPHIEVMLR